jgi:Protein of unknown function (DUF1566)/FG-GAP-like repeat
MKPTFKPNATVFTRPIVYLGAFVLALSGCGAVDDSASDGNNASSGALQVAPVANGAAPVPKWLDGTQAQTDVVMPEAVLQADAQMRLVLNGSTTDKGAPPFKADLATQHVRAMADFNGDGRADVLWQTNTGATYITTMLETTARCPTVSLGTQTDTVMGTGDFNGDSKADIVWRNMSTGAVRISLIDVEGGSAPSNVVGIKTSLSVGASPIALNVKLEGVGDFDGNGRADMLWRNQITGNSVMSYHDATGAVSSWPQVSTYIDPVRTVAFAVGDFNDDGKSDIVWRNMETGNVVLSIMNGNVPAWKSITAAPIQTWVAIEAVGDFDGNGKADILWRNRNTGRSVLSYHNADGSVASWPVVSQYINPANTSAVSVGDTDGDGKSDILWRNLATGNSVLSKMNGNVPDWNAASFSVCSSVSSTKLPHSGTAANQCYEPGSDILVPCNRKSAMQLNNQQDGHRVTIIPMSYSVVGNYPLTSCVKDNVTGLIWEGKEASGARAGSTGYTQFDSTAQAQRWTPSGYVNPTQAEIDAATNSVAYINLVNQTALCGYTDWRLPTVSELQTLQDAGVLSSISIGPSINRTWFPNTMSSNYRTSDADVSFAGYAWNVYFTGGGVRPNQRYSLLPIRLVRASQ